LSPVKPGWHVHTPLVHALLVEPSTLQPQPEHSELESALVKEHRDKAIRAQSGSPPINKADFENRTKKYEGLTLASVVADSKEAGVAGAAITA
jgi:hypothetical protein